MAQPHRLLQSQLQISPVLFYFIETGQQIITANSPRTLLFYKFSQGPLKMSLPSDNKKEFREHDTHIPNKWNG